MLDYDTAYLTAYLTAYKCMHRLVQVQSLSCKELVFADGYWT